MLQETVIALGNTLIDFFHNYGPRIATVLAIFVIGIYIARRIRGAIGALLRRSRVDETLVGFLQELVYYTAVAIIVVTALDKLGVPKTSLVAVLGTAGLAIGLALKDYLSNLAAGVMLFLNRPFAIGDVVNIAGTQGKVTGINIFMTTLKSPDNQMIFVPNSKILSGVVTNITFHPKRRMDLIIGVSYDENMTEVKRVLQEVLDKEARVLKEPAPVIGVAEFSDSSLDFNVRPWVKSSEFLSTKMALLEQIKLAFDREGISIPYPQRDVHLVHETATKKD